MERVTWGVVNTGAQQQVTINMLMKARQSSITRSMLTADDLDKSVKVNRQTKNADLMWIQESSSPAVLIYCQRNGRTACPFGQTCVLSLATRSFLNETAEHLGHIPGDTVS